MIDIRKIVGFILGIIYLIIISLFPFLLNSYLIFILGVILWLTIEEYNRYLKIRESIKPKRRTKKNANNKR